MCGFLHSVLAISIATSLMVVPCLFGVDIYKQGVVPTKLWADQTILVIGLATTLYLTELSAVVPLELVGHQIAVEKMIHALV